MRELGWATSSLHYTPTAMALHAMAAHTMQLRTCVPTPILIRLLMLLLMLLLIRLLMLRLRLRLPRHGQHRPPQAQPPPRRHLFCAARAPSASFARTRSRCTQGPWSLPRQNHTTNPLGRCPHLYPLPSHRPSSTFRHPAVITGTHAPNLSLPAE